MIDFTAACAWERARPSRSRTQGEAFGGAKGETEDEDMRRAAHAIQACGVVESVIEPSVATAPFTTSLRAGHDLVTGFSLHTGTLRDVKTIKRKRVR
jgi:hypothetical protein